MRAVVLASAAALVVFGCGPAPGPPAGPTESSTSTEPPLPTGGTSGPTDFPLDTGFGGPSDQEPDHWLYVDEVGYWNLGPAGGPWDSFAGEVTLTEILDELNLEEGPDCTVTYTWSGVALAPHSCAVCDSVFQVNFIETAGDPSTCTNPDLPPTAPGEVWHLGYESATGTIYLNVGFTGVWVPWYTAVSGGPDRLDVQYSRAWPIYVEGTE